MDFDSILQSMCFVNMNREICINLDFISYINDKNIQNVIIWVLTCIATSLNEKEKLIINLYIYNDIPSTHMKYIGVFVEMCKTKIPYDHLERLYMYTKSKYRAIASLLINFADKKTRELIEIKNI